VDSGLSALPHIVVVDAPTEADRAAILEPLAAFNQHHVRPGAYGQIAILLRDDSGTTLGGLWGTILFDWFQIELIAVPQAFRKRGLGAAILAAAEANAYAKGCRGIWVDTFAFQAPGFYRKAGYTVFGVIEDHPVGSARYFYYKKFGEPDVSCARSDLASNVPG
jgi:GNAT superfamily N-acetyltransferase